MSACDSATTSRIRPAQSEGLRCITMHICHSKAFSALWEFNPCLINEFYFKSRSTFCLCWIVNGFSVGGHCEVNWLLNAFKDDHKEGLQSPKASLCRDLTPGSSDSPDKKWPRLPPCQSLAPRACASTALLGAPPQSPPRGCRGRLGVAGTFPSLARPL